jgi:hypothetical protein
MRMRGGFKQALGIAVRPFNRTVNLKFWRNWKAAWLNMQVNMCACLGLTLRQSVAWVI